MGRMIRIGLCALLIGANSCSASQHSPEEPLEKIAVIEANLQQNAFIGPDGYYSLRRNPKEYGFALVQHLTYPTTVYEDTYASSKGMIKIGCARKSGDLQGLYDKHSVDYIHSLSLAVQKKLQSGEGVRIISKGAPKKIIVDNNPALQGGAELWKFSGDVLKGNYGSKLVSLFTLAKSKNNAYIFALTYSESQ